MSETKLAALLSLFVLGALFVTSAEVRAQSPDSLVSLLNSPEWQIRANAISQLNQFDSSELPGAYASTVIALLEEEATDPDPEFSAPGEGYGEYLIALVRGVLRLQDPASVRGLAMLGIATSRAAKEFVAAAGDAALPYLDEAWTLETVPRFWVAKTWALMLQMSPGSLTESGRATARSRIYAALDTSEYAFISGAPDAALVTAIPALEAIAAKHQGSIPIMSDVAISDVQALEPVRDAMSAGEFAMEFVELLEAVCLETEGAKADTCSSLDALLADATGFISSGDEVSAGGSMMQFATEVDQAAGVLSEGETTLLSGNAAYLAGILEPGEGCGPGFWKQPHHSSFWTGHAPGDDYGSTFGVAPSSSVDLLGALQQSGGGQEALGRQAVAALLNAASLEIDFALSENEIVSLVQSAYATDGFEGVKDSLEARNGDATVCPLD